MKVLVTGGAGFIGSHTVLELLQAGHEVTVVDNLCNSSERAVERVQQLAGVPLEFIRGDVRERDSLEQVLRLRKIDAVLHFAGLKAVGDSLREPLAYYDNNVSGTLALCQAMARAGVFRLIFSSSATVYGEPTAVPISESCPTAEPTNPYGRSKLMAERILQDISQANPGWSIGLLRYFNPVGAHPSGLIGEEPRGVPNNLLPYVCQVAIGKLAQLSVHGGDYPTADGTCIRDYIHVQDLALGHLRALEFIMADSGCHIWNLGTGTGYSVLEVVRAFEQASGRQVPFTIGPRRDGDIAASWADPVKAWRELGWKTERDLPQMMADSWRWQIKNPHGYS
ncbi:MAG: UDP-glucose 4-epimerase GalE [Pseudomonas sp.]